LENAPAREGTHAACLVIGLDADGTLAALHTAITAALLSGDAGVYMRE